MNTQVQITLILHKFNAQDKMEFAGYLEAYLAH